MDDSTTHAHDDTFTPLPSQSRASVGVEKNEPRMHVVETEPIVIETVKEHEPSPDVAPYVQHRKETIQLPPEIEKLGGVATGHTAYPTTNTVVLPLSDDQVYKGLSAPLTSSVRWLAELCLFFLKQAHLTLKKVHGKIMRVFTR